MSQLEHVSADLGVQLAVDGIGKRVRTLDLTVMLGDGSVATVEMQVVSIADKSGNVLDFGEIERLLGHLVETTDNILEFLEEHAT